MVRMFFLETNFAQKKHTNVIVMTVLFVQIIWSIVSLSSFSTYHFIHMVINYQLMRFPFSLTPQHLSSHCKVELLENSAHQRLVGRHHSSTLCSQGEGLQCYWTCRGCYNNRKKRLSSYIKRFGGDVLFHDWSDSMMFLHMSFPSCSDKLTVDSPICKCPCSNIQIPLPILETIRTDKKVPQIFS